MLNLSEALGEPAEEERVVDSLLGIEWIKKEDLKPILKLLRQNYQTNEEKLSKEWVQRVEEGLARELEELPTRRFKE